MAFYGYEPYPLRKILPFSPEVVVKIYCEICKEFLFHQIVFIILVKKISKQVFHSWLIHVGKYIRNDRSVDLRGGFVNSCLPPWLAANLDSLTWKYTQWTRKDNFILKLVGKRKIYFIWSNCGSFYKNLHNWNETC